MTAHRYQVFLCVCFSLMDGYGVYAARKERVGLRGVSADLPHFVSFVDLFRRSYKVGSAEYEHRRAIYDSRVEGVQQHNVKEGRRWTAGVNALSDWTEAELTVLRGWKGGKRASAGSSSKGHLATSQSHSGLLLSQATKGTTLPREVTWLHLNKSSQVRNQGGCGSCWAVAASTILEAHAEIYGRPRTFSAQELVSCVPNPDHCGGTGGCQGATVELALEYVMKNGLADEAAKPYLGEDEQCDGNKKTATLLGTSGDTLKASDGNALGMTSWERLPENKYEPLMRALYERGPVGVSVAASSWSTYTDGVFDGCDMDAVIDHAVTLLAYGEEVNQVSGLKDKYWTIQNSWGPDWGESGHIRLLRRDEDASEHCGVDHQPEEGTACAGGPKQVTVCGMCGILYDSSLPHFVGDGSAAKARAFNA